MKKIGLVFALCLSPFIVNASEISEHLSLLQSSSDDLIDYIPDTALVEKQEQAIKLIYNCLKEENYRVDLAERLATLGDAYHISARLVPFYDRIGTEFYTEDGNWTLIDHEQNLIYIKLDNHSLAGHGEIVDDPFLALRTKIGGKQCKMDVKASWENLAHFKALAPVTYSQLEPMDHPRDLFFQAKVTQPDLPSSITVENKHSCFAFVSPYFILKSLKKCEQIWWQIAKDPEFSFIIPNFEGMQDFEQILRLDRLTDTFFNNEGDYYFRVKGSHNGVWSDWSSPFAFHVTKPETVKRISFEKRGTDCYELSWEGVIDGVRYHLFASNARDFIPSIYYDKHIEAISSNEMLHEPNENLVAITSENRIQITGKYAYYRIIAEQNGQFSVPSPLIYIYDKGVTHRRTILQMGSGVDSAQRRVFPSAYPNEFFNDPIHMNIAENEAAEPLVELLGYPVNPYVSSTRWKAMVPHFLPENHPIKATLDRIFSERITLTTSTLSKAGFPTPYPRRASKTIVSTHAKLPGYFVKCFTDDQKSVDDWRKLKRRIDGAERIKKAIVRNHYEEIFKVPKKWIYPLPNDPSPPKGSSRKNFILIAEDVNILAKEANYAAWKGKPMTKQKAEAVFTILNEEGLCDSIFAFNIPFTKDDGKMAFIDTEQWHCWPVNFKRVREYFSPTMQKYWDNLVKTRPHHKKAPK